MRFGRSGWICLGLAAGFLLLICAVPALAQSTSSDEKWIDVTHLPWNKPWLQWLLATLFAVMCLLVAFKNPHRSHLD